MHALANVGACFCYVVVVSDVYVCVWGGGGGIVNPSVGLHLQWMYMHVCTLVSLQLPISR